MSSTCPRRLAELRLTLAGWPWTAPVPTAELVVEETNRRVATAYEEPDRGALTVSVEDYRALLAHG